MKGEMVLDNGVAVKVHVHVQEVECPPLLGFDFINYYKAISSLRVDHGELIVRKPTGQYITPLRRRPYIVGRVAGMPFRALLDTGSTTTYLTHETAQRLDLHIARLSKAVAVMTADGIVYRRKAVPRLDLKVAGKEFQL